MPNRKLCTGSAALVCLTLCGTAAATPTLKILYHERLDLVSRDEASGQQRVSFDAYGRHFDVDLQANDHIARAVPADRSDIKPYLGTVAGQAGSWARLTQTREGWRGIVDDGQDLYAIEPAADLRAAAVQPLPEGAIGSTSVIYRLADAIMPEGAAYCGTDTNGSGTALESFRQLAKELSTASTAEIPSKELVVGVVADHTFTDAVGADPVGAIVARMDIVDGIWSTQVGIRIALAPATILTDRTERFSATTDSKALLAEVAGYRARLSAHAAIGLTHLMTGRAMNGNIVGIAYLGAVCKGANSVSLSQSTISTIMGALIAAHELGHSFNAVHDGVPGICSTTPETYLMAPTINFSQRFSPCSLTQIKLRAQSASCVVKIPPTAGGSPPTATPPTSAGGGTGGGSNGGGVSTGGGDSTSGSAGVGAGTGGGGSLDPRCLLFLASTLLLRQARSPRPPTKQTRPANPSHPPGPLVSQSPR
jgi:hypothetical protein